MVCMYYIIYHSDTLFDFPFYPANCLWSSSLSQMLNLQPSLPWGTWQELRNESETNSESVLSMILEAKVGAA